MIGYCKYILRNVRREVSGVFHIDLGLKFVIVLHVELLFVYNLTLNLACVFYHNNKK
jgi:hypothetical protein